MTKQITTLILALCVLTAHSALAAEQVTYYHNNAIGSPVAATDETGALLWQQTYDLWGDPLVSGPVDPRAFTGAPRDADTGNSDLGARWYNPLLGRFLAPDPVGFQPSNIHSFNRYAYGANNPYVFVDPNGKIAIAALIWGAIMVASTADTAYASYQTYQSDGITAAATGAAINLIAGPLGKVKKIARAARRVFTRSDVTKGIRSVDDLIKNSKPGRGTKGRTKLFDRSGGVGQANKDFDALNPSGVKGIPDGRVGKLEDGRTVIVRSKSSDGRPTLEIQQGKSKTKFRFDD